MEEKNLIAVEAEKLQLQNETKQNLIQAFKGYFDKAEKLEEKAKLIKVENENQIEEMGKARDMRLQLKNIRVGVEKKRIELKEDSKRKGKAIDGMANIIKYLIQPIEKHLQDQEDFVKVRQEKKLDILEEKRKNEMLKYTEEIEFFDLRSMNEETYNILIESNRKKYEEAKQAIEKAEQERIAREKAIAVENEKIRIDNEKLKKEAEEREKQAQIEREKQERKESELQIKLKSEAAERDRLAEIEKQKQAKKEAELQEKLKKEAEEKQALQNKIDKEKAEAEQRKQDELKKKQERKEATEKAEREKALAPDKDKLNDLAKDIVNLKMPEVKDEKAKIIINKVIDLLNNTGSYIKKEIINL